MAITNKQVAIVLESINGGGNAGTGYHQSAEHSAGGPESIPNPNDKKRQRPGLFPFREDVNMEGAPASVIIPSLPCGNKAPSVPDPFLFQIQAVAEGGS